MIGMLRTATRAATRSRTAGLVALQAALMLTVLGTSAEAQVVRNFTSRYTNTDRGNFVAIGNTLMTCPDATSTCAAARAGTGSINNNQDFAMIAVDVDTTDAAANSSSATLALPAGSTVRFAGLYWGAASSSAARNIAKLRTPASSAYNTLTASQLDASGTAYHAYADVTSLVTAAGSGVYTVADVKAVTGANSYAGWSLVVVYSDSTESPHNVTVFDGYAIVASGGGSVSIPVSGFVTPPSGTVNTRIADVAYEGDLGSPGNSVKLNSIALTNAVNPANNYFNSTISLLGAHVTTKTPNYVNQLGFDIDTTDASGILTNSATSATAVFSPGSDNYFPGVLVFSTEIFQPLLAPNFTKTVSDVNGGLLTPGDVLQYTVSVSNTGNDAADSVVLTDAIPANTTYVAGSLNVVSGANIGAKTDGSGDDQAEYDSASNRVVFRLGTGATSAAGGSLATSASTSLTFRVLIGSGTANGTSIANSAHITYIEHQLGGAVAIDSSTATATISLPDLTIAKSHSASFVRGAAGTYSVVVSNSGLGATSGTVTMTDTLPAGLTPTSATGTGWSCSIASQTVTCTRSDALAAGASYPAISISASVSQSAPSSLTNTATASGGGQITTTNDSASDVTAITSSADLAITKSGTTTTFAGGTVVYTVAVTNNGSSNAAGVIVSDPTPTGLTFVSNTGACTTAYPCSLGALAAGATATITTTYTVPGSFATPATIVNTATVSSSTADPVSSNDSATASTAVTVSTDLSISKSGPSSVVAGSTVVYTVAVSNLGGTAATSVGVTDPTPSGLTFVSNTGACTTAYPCSLGTLGSGATATITSTYSVPASYTAPNPIVNSATVSTATTDTVSSNNSSSSSTSVTTSADVAITKIGPASIVAGANAVYTVTVTNNGTSDASAVSVADATPSGLTFVSNTGACTTAYPCSLGTVAAGATRTITTTYSVPSAYTTPNPVVNTATVSSTTTDPTPGNNSATSSIAATQRADLAITKSGPASAIAGGTVVYTVTVTNNGSSDASSVSVADPTPSGLTFVSNTGACTTAYPCSLGSMTAGAVRTITTTYSLPITYSTPTTIVNTATVSSSTTDPTPANNSASASTPVTPSTDLSISKTGPASVAAGNNVTYTVAVTNNGGISASSVSVADPTPAGLVFVSNSGACATAYPCSLGTLAASATATITSIYTVPSSYTAPNPIVNTATVSSATTDSVAGNNSSSTSATVSTSADLAISKSGPAAVIPGQNVVYTVSVTNNGSSDASSVSVADATPSGLSFVSNSGACTTAYPCSLGTVAAGATATITTTYSVPASYTSPNPVVNTATVSSSTTDPTPANDSATSSIPVTPRADLAVTKTGSASAIAGGTVVYTVTVTNNGSSDAQSVSVDDPTPSGLVFVSNAGACTGAYPCSLGTLTPGAIRTITTTYSLPITYAAPSTITNTATVSSATSDPVPANDSATASTPVTPSTDLSITKTGPASATAGDNVVYTVVVSNNGGLAAASVSVDDPTPAGLGFVSNSGACATAYPCSLGSIPAGSSATITTTYSLPSSYTTPDPIVNTATVSSATTDSIPANNSSTASTPVATSADLSISKIGPAAIVPGQDALFTVTVTNNGSSDAAAVVASDATPSGLTFLSNSGDCLTTWPCSFGTIAAGESRTVTTTYSVPASYTAPDPVLNTATVTSGTSDPIPGNNSATSSTPVSASADLEITESGPASAVAGGSVVYTVTVTNLGSSDAASVSIADTTPAGLTFVSNSGDCTSSWPCAFATLAAGASRTITSTYGVPASYTTPDPILNTASVSSATTDPVGANNSATSSTPVTTSADLEIAKSGPPSVIAGNDVVYTITVTNHGTSDASAVSVADATPAGLVFASNTGDCTSAYPCSLGTVEAGGTRTITTTYSVPASHTTPNPIVNTAEVSSATTDPSSANNSATASTPVLARADLALTKNGPATVIAGTEIVYTVTLTNNGVSDAASVSVADATPAGLVFVSNSGDCSSSYPCSFGTLAPGAVRTVTTTYRVPASYTTPNPIVNTATASSTTTDPVPANNSATSSTSVTTSADVSIVKLAPEAVIAGTDLVYTVIVTNNGDSDALSVSVADPTPTGLTFVSNSGACATAYPCALGTLAPGQTRTITSTYSVPLTYTTPVPIVNTATVSSATSDPVPSNNSSTTSTSLTILNAELEITKLGPATAVPGSNLVYTITVTNHGPDVAPSTTVSDPTPFGVTLVSNAGACTTAYPCSLGSLAVGATRTITSTYSVPASYTTPDPITNSAFVSSSVGDSDGTNNRSTAVTPVAASAGLSIDKTGPASIVAGTSIAYTVTVTNSGPSDAMSVSIADPTPAGLVFLANDGGCSGGYPCSLGSIAAGSSASITTRYAVPASYAAPGPIQNTATVSSATGDADSSDNSSTASTTVTTSADLAITKSGPSVITAGHSLVYTVTVTNNGSSDAAAVTVADPSPSGLVFVSNTGACTTAYPCSLGTVAAGATATITTTYTVPASYTSPDPIVNTATVASSTTDPIAGNNSSSTSTALLTSADLSIVKTGPASATPGENVVYTIAVTNSGSSDAAAVAIADPTPAGLTFVSNAGACTTAYPCSLGIVPAGTTQTITTTYALPASYSTPDPIVNTATVSSATTDPVSANDSSASSTPVSASADLTVTKNGPASVVAGGSVIYSVTVTNNGSSDAAAVTVADPTPSGLTFVSNTGDCLNAYPCSFGTLAPGVTRTITSVYTVPPSYTAPNPIVNTATASSTTADADSSDNTASASTAVTTSANLSITKSDATDPVETGGSEVYTIRVENLGPSNATGVIVTDTLDPNTTHVSNTGGCSGSATLTCNLGSLAAGASRTFTVTVGVSDLAPTDGTLTTGPCDGSEDICNTATVSASQTDSDASNNTATEPTDVEPLHLEGLMLAITDAPDATTPSGSVTYVLTYSNAGPQRIANARLVVSYDSRTTFVSSLPDPSAGDDEWLLGTLEIGEVGEIRITVDVDGSVVDGDSLTATAELSGDHAVVADATEDTAVREDAPDHAALSVTKTAATASVYSGGLFTFTITVHNDGPATSYATAVTDSLPAGLTYLNASPAPDLVSGSTVGWNAGDVASGDTATFVLYAQGDDTLTAGTLLENDAFADGTPGAGTTESAGLHADGSDVVSVSGPGGDCDIVVRLRSLGIALPGGEFVYRLLWEDPCDDAPGATIVQQLPPELTFASLSSADVDSYSVDTVGDHQNVTLDLGTIEHGRVGAAFVRGRLADDVVPGTVLTSSLGLSDAAGRTLGATDDSVVHDIDDVLVTRSYLRVTGPLRVISGSTRIYVMRYRDIPPGSSMTVTITGHFQPLSLRPDATEILAPPAGTSYAYEWRDLGDRGVIRIRGNALFDGPAEANGVISMDAVLSTPAGVEIVKSGRDIGVLGRGAVSQSSSLSKGRVVLKTQHFARGGSGGATRVRFRKLFDAPIVTLNLPTFLGPRSSKPAPTSSTDNAFFWDEFVENKGVVQVKVAVPEDLAPQASLGVGATVTDGFGSIAVERAKGAP